MAYDAKAIANYFLDLADEHKTSLTPMKLQKLIFFAHGWHLALYDEPLIADQVEAWQFGPVVPSIYQEFKHERSGAISTKATEFDLEKFDFLEPVVPKNDVRARGILDKVWQAYGKLTAIQLSNLTHLPDTPWANARAKHAADARKVPIDDESIRVHFRALAEKNRVARNQEAA
jgi:uncharacterized phage-associated protein